MSTKKPVFLLAGGRPTAGKSSDSLVEAVFREYGVSSPIVAYSGTANGDDKGFFQRMAGMFRDMGARRVEHALIAAPGADIGKAKAMLEAADIIFISGGDVDTGMRILEEKGITGFLTELYESGKPFFGLSAGSIMLGREWVRWTNPDDEHSAELFPCLGFAPVICDTHDELDGWEELQAALALKPEGTEGYGIASGTAIKVYPDGRVEALGGPVHRYIHKGSAVKREDNILPE